MDELPKIKRACISRTIWKRKAAMLMASGRSFRETAAEIGVSSATLIRWSKSPEFKKRLDSAVDDMVSEFHRKNNRHLLEIIDRLDDICLGKTKGSPTALAAMQTKYRWAMDWNVVRKVEEARRVLEEQRGENSGD